MFGLDWARVRGQPQGVPLRALIGRGRGQFRFAFCLNRDLQDCESGFSGLLLHVFDGNGVACWTFAGWRSLVGAIRGLGGCIWWRAHMLGRRHSAG